MEYRSRRRRGFSLSLNIVTVSKLARLAFYGVLAGIVLTFILFVWYSRDLPTPGKLTSSNLSQSTRIMDRNGIVLYDVFETQNRTYVPLSDITKNAQLATISIEDKTFYTNEGYSFIGYLRAFRNFFLYRGISGGGSTLTQQLVKQTLLSSEQTLPRKIKELILATQVDRKYSKDQILELYLNVAPYGGTIVGIETASETYFGKKAKDLSLTESAVLASFPQRPSYFSPYGAYPKAYIGRATDVLRRMREDGYITEKQEQASVKELPNIKFLKQSHAIKAPHFSFYVKNLLIEEFGESMVENGGLQVTTSLDYKLQESAEEIVKDEVDSAKSLKVGNGASIALNPQTGEILSLVGSKDFFATESAETKTTTTPFDGQYNVITQALRQPGSSIKPVTYATALAKGYTGATILMDVKTTFPNQGEKDYVPVNYDGKYHGPVQMRVALASSLNIPAVKMLAMVGVKDMLTTASNMGLTTLAPTDENTKRFGLSLTLGGGEVHPIDLAGAYSAFANGGYKVEPIAILKITDSKGKLLYENKPKSKQRVISEEVAFIMSSMLSDNNARLLTFGENSYLNIRGKQVAVKTGTTDDKRDNWAIGWTPSIIVAAWVGNNDNSPMGNVASGVTGATPIWRRIILEALKTLPNETFKKPDNVVEMTVDAFGGGAPVDGKPTRSEAFIKGTEPQGPGPIYKDLKVSKADTNKLASESELAKNEWQYRKYVVFAETDPVSTDGKNRWQEAINDWLKDYNKDDPLYHPPTETSNRVVSDTPTPTPNP